MPQATAREAKLNRLARWTLVLGTLLAISQLARLDLPLSTPRHLVVLSMAPEAAEDVLAASTSPRAEVVKLDRFLEEATVFHQAIAQSDSMEASLRSLFTGRYPTATLFRRGSIPAPLLAEELRNAGFHTAAFAADGIPAKSRDWLEPGFATWNDEFADSASRTDAALEWLSAKRSRAFLFLQIDGADTIGQAEEFIERLGKDDLLNKSLIVLLTPHAKHAGSGVALHAESLRVPLAFRLPRNERRRFGALVELIDVAPTLYALLELPGPANLPGRSLQHAIQTGVALPGDHLAYAQKGFGQGWHALIGDELELLVNRANGDVFLFELGDGRDATADIGDQRRVRRAELRQILRRRLETSVDERRRLLKQAEKPSGKATSATHHQE